MHATTIESLNAVVQNYDLSEPSRPAPAKIDLDLDNARSETHLWKLRVASEVRVKIETILVLILGVLGTGVCACSAEQMFNFVNGDAMAHAVSALLR